MGTAMTSNRIMPRPAVITGLCLFALTVAAQPKHRQAKILVYDTDKTDCQGRPSPIGACSKMGSHFEHYQCLGDQIMLQKCKDSECKKCGPMKLNPYGYKPNLCQNDYLKIVCTNQPMAGGGGGGKKGGVEAAAKQRLAALEGPPAGSTASASSAENTAKDRIKAMNSGGAPPQPAAGGKPSPEKTAKDRLKAMQAGHSEF